MNIAQLSNIQSHLEGIRNSLADIDATCSKAFDETGANRSCEQLTTDPQEYIIVAKSNDKSAKKLYWNGDHWSNSKASLSPYYDEDMAVGIADNLKRPSEFHKRPKVVKA